MSSQNRPLVLIVEDEALVRMLLVDVFEDEGFEILEAADGEQAITFLRSRQDIRGVLTDVQMPGPVNGFEVARIAKTECPGCLIVIASGRQWPRIGDVPDGAEFVQKPFSPAVIVQRFASLRASP
jgi:CheY-like chemotaxis protein